jgi:N-acetylglutamate synthase-like GNAT family acetyltransferase
MYIPAMIANRITIRRFRPTDAPAVVALVLGIQNDEFHLGLSICDQRDLEDIEAYYLQRRGTFLVGETSGGDIVGTIGLLRLSDDLGVMKKFFVAAPYRGSTHGVARALYAEFLDFARQEGMREIVLDTPSAATRSHAFYRAVGFRQIDRADIPMQYDFPERDTLFFSLSLAALAADSGRRTS